jgi:hypothetical protein
MSARIWLSEWFSTTNTRSLVAPVEPGAEDGDAERAWCPVRRVGDGDVTSAVGGPEVGVEVGPAAVEVLALREPPQPASASAETAT